MRTGGWKPALCWACYDLANSAFALMILTAIYPVFFGRYFADGMEASRSTFWYGLSASVAGLVVALAAPFLGAAADRRGSRRKDLGLATLAGAMATAGLAVVGQGQWAWACVLYGVGVVGYSVGNLYYDSLLNQVSEANNRHRVSAFGFSLGYAGSVLLLIATLIVVGNPGLVGLPDASSVVRVSFLATAVWWLVFALPILIGVREQAADQVRPDQPFWSAVTERLLGQARKVLSLKGMWLFFLAYWFYIDGVNTVIKMAPKLAHDLGFAHQELMAAIVLVQIVAVPSTIVYGWLAQLWGARRLLRAGVLTYIGVTVYAAFLTPDPVIVAGLAISPLYLLAAMIGAVQGGLQSVSRSYFASFIPPGEEGAFFGFYNVVGRAATVVGPGLVGLATLLTGHSQHGILVLVGFFAIGGVLLGFLPETAGARRRRADHS